MIGLFVLVVIFLIFLFVYCKCKKRKNRVIYTSLEAIEMGRVNRAVENPLTS